MCLRSCDRLSSPASVMFAQLIVRDSCHYSLPVEVKSGCMKRRKMSKSL